MGVIRISARGPNTLCIRFRWLVAVLLISLIMPINLWAQILEFDQNPPGLRWRQIQTPNFRLIYPSTFEQRAQDLGTRLEEMVRRLDRHTGKTRRIPILLQNQSVLSNGFVQLAPRRSEFVTTPGSEPEMSSWLEQLAIHELQHVTQFDRLVGQFRAPFFEQLGLALYGLTLPAWYFEGDAVWAETTWTDGGRGRIPSWTMPYRANLLSGRQFSYQKDYLGSYRDVTPGFYQMGYFMVDKLYRDYGVQFGSTLMDRMSANLLRPYNFSRTLRHFTGYTTREWHRETVSELRAMWQAQSNADGVDDDGVLPARTGGKPDHWLLPQSVSDGELLVLHQGIGTPAELVWLDSSKHPTGRRIRIGPQTAPHFSATGSRIVWDEIRRNPRYAKQTFNVISTYDMEARRFRQLTRRTRLFSPALHPDGSVIACVEIREDNRSSVILVSWDDGSVIRELPTDDPEITLHTPSFNAAGTRLVLVATSRKGSTLLELDLGTGQYTRVLPWQLQHLERPIYAGKHNDRIVFKAHYNGIDNLYEWNSSTRTLHQMTHVRFGAFNPAIDSVRNQLLFNHYDVDGYRIGTMMLEEEGAPLLEEITDHSTPSVDDRPFFGVNDTGQAETRADALAGTSAWDSRPYREIPNLLNFHSLSITPSDFSDPDNLSAGIYWLSDNLLNTLQTRMGYLYDGDIRSSSYTLGTTYQRYYPIIDLSYTNRGNTGVLRQKVAENAGDRAPTAGLRWRENHFNLQLQIPLVFFKRHRIYRLSGAVGTQFTERYGLSINSDPAHWDLTATEREQAAANFTYRIRFPLRYSVSFSHLLRRSALDLGPRWGQSVALAFRHTPFGPVSGDPSQRNQLFTLRTAFYFPGLMRHHTTLVRFSYQAGRGAYLNGNNVPLVRGTDFMDPELVNNTLLVDYAFPIAYPDWEIGALAYIKRVRGGAFVDFQNFLRSPSAANRPRSFGLELRADVHLLRFVLPEFDIGARLVVVPEPARSQSRLHLTYGISYHY